MTKPSPLLVPARVASTRRTFLGGAAALTAAGARSTAVYYPDVSHSGIVMALARPFRHIARVLDDASGFFSTHL